MFSLKSNGLHHNKQQNNAHLHTVPDYMLHENWDVQVWKRGSRAACNIAFFLEKQEKKIVANMISKYRNFSWNNYYSISSLLHGHSFFHLDNPVPNPVETETLSNPNPKNSWYPAGLDSKIRILYTTAVHHHSIPSVHWQAQFNVVSDYICKLWVFEVIDMVLLCLFCVNIHFSVQVV